MSFHSSTESDIPVKLQNLAQSDAPVPDIHALTNSCNFNLIIKKRFCEGFKTASNSSWHSRGVFTCTRTCICFSKIVRVYCLNIFSVRTFDIILFDVIKHYFYILFACALRCVEHKPGFMLKSEDCLWCTTDTLPALEIGFSLQFLWT